MSTQGYVQTGIAVAFFISCTLMWDLIVNPSAVDANWSHLKDPTNSFIVRLALPISMAIRGFAALSVLYAQFSSGKDSLTHVFIIPGILYFLGLAGPIFVTLAIGIGIANRPGSKPIVPLNPLVPMPMASDCPVNPAPIPIATHAETA